MSGTVQSKAALLAEFASGQAPGSITPTAVQNLIASVPSLAANAYAPGAATGRYYAGVSPQSTGSLYQASGIATVSLLQLEETVTFTKAGIEVMPLAPASRLADFKAFIGVNTHVGNGTSPYTNATNVLTDLQTLGFTNIRDRVAAAADTTTQGLYGTLIASGIKMSLIPQGDGSGAAMLPATHVADLKASISAWGSNPLLSVETVNEPFGQNTLFYGLNSNTTAQGVMLYQEALYKAVKSDPVLSGLQMWGVTNVIQQQENTGLQFLTVPYNNEWTGCLAAGGTKFADVINFHDYITPVRQPIDATAGEHFLSTDGHLYNEFVVQFGTNVPGYPNLQVVYALPRVIGEYGYQTNSAAGSGNYFDNATQGKCLLNAALLAFRDGFQNFFIYSLYDTGGEFFGLFTTTATAKSAATYFHNLMTIMADSGTDATTFNAGSPGNIVFTGLPALSYSVHFQKSDGSYWLAIGCCIDNWNNGTNAAITITGSSVTVTLPQTFATINVFDPTVGTSVQATTTSANTVTLTIKDYPKLIQLIPAASSTHVQWALYAMANGIPTGAPVYLSANHTAPLAADVIEETGLSVTLQPGVYAACVVSDGPCGVRGIADAGGSGLLGFTTSKVAAGALGFSTTLNTGTPASTWPTNPTTTMNAQPGGLSPLVWVRP